MTTRFRDPYPVIQGIKVDLLGLLSIRHTCRPDNCKDRKSCCQTYEVMVDSNQFSDIVGAMSGAVKFVPGLIKEGEYVDPFEDAEGGTCLQADEDGLCIFAFKGPSGEVLCSLHAAALEWEIEPIQAKPKSCVLWPLALVDSTPSYLTVQDDAMDFLCNSTADIDNAKLDDEIESIIRSVFGELFLEELKSLLR